MEELKKLSSKSKQLLDAVIKMFMMLKYFVNVMKLCLNLIDAINAGGV